MAATNRKPAPPSTAGKQPGDSLKDKIDEIAVKIIQIETQKQCLVSSFKEIKASFTFPDAFMDNYHVLDKTLFEAIPLNPPAGIQIAAVDGSILRESMLGVDIVASKARGAVFKFYSRRPPVVAYYPREHNANFNVQCFFTRSSLSELEFYTNAERLCIELELVHEILKTEPGLHLMIVDGSLLIPEVFTPSRDQYAEQYCRRLTELMIDIINTCEENGTVLVGVVKDSTRSEHASLLRHLIPIAAKDDKTFEPFLQFDYPNVLELMKDYDFFYRFLDQGERSFALKSHPKATDFIPSNLFERFLKVKDLGLYSYLLKPVPLDVPLRVEFFAPNDPAIVKKHVTRSSSMLYPLSSIVFNYSEPSPQMEAHKRVKIQEQDFKILIDVLRRKTGYCSTMLQKRRERKPL